MLTKDEYARLERVMGDLDSRTYNENDLHWLSNMAAQLNAECERLRCCGNCEHWLSGWCYVDDLHCIEKDADGGCDDDSGWEARDA